MAKRKKNPKNEDSTRSSGTTSSMPAFVLWRCQKEKRESKELKTYVKNIIIENFPNLVMEIDIPSPGSTDSPQKDEPKEVHTKTYH